MNKEKEKRQCRINSFCACWVRTNDTSIAPQRGCLRALCAASALRPACAMGFSCSLLMQGCPSACFLSFWERYARRCALLPPCRSGAGQAGAQREEKPAGTAVRKVPASRRAGDENREAGRTYPAGHGKHRAAGSVLFLLPAAVFLRHALFGSLTLICYPVLYFKKKLDDLSRFGGRRCA